MSFFVMNASEPEPEGEASGSSTQLAPANTEAQANLQHFWPKITEEIRKIATVSSLDLKQQALPLARIKKIMKLDEEVKMISSEAPVLFAKAAEIFILELTLRAWVHTEDNKRRTLQRNDIAMAITKYDQFDFLIDIVPRDEIKPAKRSEDSGSRTTSMNPDQVHYYFQLAQQHQQALQQAAQITSTGQQTTQTQSIQVVQAPGQQMQTINVVPSTSTASTQAVTTTEAAGQQAQQQQQQPHVIQLQPPAVQNQPQATAAQQGGIQIVQQIVTPSGEIQQIPVRG
ncbi:hypothetical protein B566_EDAN002576, partial [Ephemera danica]